MTSAKNNSKKREETRASSWASTKARKADGTHPKARRKAANEALHKEKVAHGGLGRRERRRIAAGVRKG